MIERRLDGQDGLAKRGGREREGWHLWVDQRDGRVYWKRDANSLGEDDPRYQGGYNSPFAQLGSIMPTRGRHTKRIPSEE